MEERLRSISIVETLSQYVNKFLKFNQNHYFNILTFLFFILVHPFVGNTAGARTRFFQK